MAALLAAEVPRRMAELLAELCAALTRRLAAEAAEPELLEVAEDIVDGIERGHPDWDAETKRRFACDAIAHYLHTVGVSARESTINVLTELAVVSLDKIDPEED
jgi:hypothetical protein